MRIAFAGNPNSGKTTMYNALTGRNERVGNWAGVTVEKKVAPIKKNLYRGADLLAVDLPGAYSMTPFTVEESVTATFINEANPDAIINIVDATNLSRSLFFTTQLMELGIPMVVALNKSDVNEKRETVIDIAALSAALHCPVVETVSTDTGDAGLRQVVSAAVARAGEVQVAPYQAAELEITDKETAEQADRARFAFVNELVSRVERRKVRSHVRTPQDTLDDVLTSRWAGIPIFAVVMFLVFQISQAWVGPWFADLLVGWLEAGQEALRGLVSGASDIVQALLIDGIVGGVIAVVGFLPLVMVMYFLMALLEDCGYMARVSVVLDPIFKKVGPPASPSSPLLSVPAALSPV